ncbi:MAG: helix-turn-helix domain-containing protein [Bacteroidales bacterium]|nr:helix-turn-helix domain-containing protein [Bacteroidales bacterium]
MEKKNLSTQLKADLTIYLFKLAEFDEVILDANQENDFHQLLWITKCSGNNTCTIDYNDYTFRDNQIVVIYPRQTGEIDLEGKEGYLLVINNDIFFEINQIVNSNYLNGYFSNVFVSIDEKTRQSLTAILSLMFQEYEGLNREVLMKSYLQSLLFHVASLYRKDTLLNNQTTQLFVDFIKLVDQNFVEHREVKFYADELNLSEKKLNEICKTASGKTTKQFIQERLVLEIKKEIKSGTSTLKEIAFNLGFSEPEYFTRFFKQQTSMTPKEFSEK